MAWPACPASEACLSRMRRRRLPMAKARAPKMSASTACTDGTMCAHSTVDPILRRAPAAKRILSSGWTRSLAIGSVAGRTFLIGSSGSHGSRLQSLWMQAGWILMAFVGGGLFCLLLRCFVRTRARYMRGNSHLEVSCYTVERERLLEYALGVLTIGCFLVFADETCELGENRRYLHWKHGRALEEVTCAVMLLCFCLRLFFHPGLDHSCPRLMRFLTSPLMWVDLAAMLPTLLEMLLQKYDIFPNLIWLRFPRLLDVILRAGDGEGIGVIKRLVAANSSLLMISVNLLCTMWLACSTVHYLTEHDNDSFFWGVEPGYQRYVSIPSAMYYALIDFNGEFPNADEFSAPWGRANSMVICLLGTYVLSIPVGVLGAAFRDHVSRNFKSEGDQGVLMEPPPSRAWAALLVSVVVLSTGNFVLLTTVYQKPVQEEDRAGHSFEEGSWQRSLLAPCRFLDVLLALPFLLRWAGRLVWTQNVRRYIFSIVHVADVLAWLPAYFLLLSLLQHGSCLEHTGSPRQTSLARTQLALHGLCMMRWPRLDGVFGGIFHDLKITLVANKIIFRMTLICATTLWLLAAVLMYYAERNNPDEGTRSHFRTLPLSMWMTALDFTSEAPVNDHSAQGKAVHALIMLLGVGVFTVPMGLFASAFRQRLDERHAQTLGRSAPGPEEEQRHCGRRVSETAFALAQEQYRSMSVAFSMLEQERACGVWRDVYDVEDKNLMRLRPGTWRYKCYRLLMGKTHPGNGRNARWLQNAIIFNTALCCFTSCVETLSYFDDCSKSGEFDTGLGFVWLAEQCSSLSRGLSGLALLCSLGFLAELGARFWCHPQPWALLLHPTTLADLLALGSLPVTLAFLAGAPVGYGWMNLARTLRIWRLLALERFVPAFRDVLGVLVSRGYQLLQVFYVLLSFWFMMATYNWYFLHSEFEVESEDKTFACWYSNYWYAMQFTLIHMSGDYPMTEYPVKVRVVHMCSLFLAWAFVTMPAAMLAAAFHDALEKRRLVAARQRRQAMTKIVRMLRRIILRRRFRQVADQALWAHRGQLTKVGLARLKYPGLARLLRLLHSNEQYHFVLGTATVLHVGLAGLRTIPELRPQAVVWDVAMLPLASFFMLNFLGRLVTAFMNPSRSCHCSPLRFLCSYQRLLKLVALGLYFAHLVYPEDGKLLRWSCAAQMALILHFGQILGTSCLLSLVWSEIRETFWVMCFVSGTFWVLSSTLWYLAEDGGQGMTDMFSTLYYTCIFLLGEWCSFDFSPAGAGLSMLYSIVGVGLNAMPMAAVQDALTNLTDMGAYHVVMERRKILHSHSGAFDSNASNSQNADWRPRKTELEMQIWSSLDQPMV
ncbi:unnamed protein product [Effrenium voratum]|uniref:Ion transport domain-containing protein n=1 Tax=Effrenium voratum TaxID=2562239 RepID=A0AA36JIM5_9DINO|nr:unnamed protein product [Effrenium voratum]